MIQEDPVAHRRANRVWQGSYWLMMGTLLAVALGVLAVANSFPPDWWEIIHSISQPVKN